MFHKVVIYIIVILNATSCSYKSTEEDKYPEMPLFPENSNSKIKFTKLNSSFKACYKIDDLFFKFHEVRNKKTNYETLSFLYYFKNDFINKKDSVFIYNENFIDKNGILYSNEYDGDKAFKLDIKTGKKSTLNYLDYNASKRYDALLKKLEKKELPDENNFSDSLKMIARFNRRDKVGSNIIEEFKRIVLPGLLRVEQLNNDKENSLFLLKYEDREVLIKGVIDINIRGDDEFTGPISILYKYEHFNKLKPLVFEETNFLTITDKAIMRNILGTGGKFGDVFVQSGFQYYQLDFKGVKSTFKFDAKNIDRNGSLKTFLSYDNKTNILLNEEGYKSIYYKISYD